MLYMSNLFSSIQEFQVRFCSKQRYLTAFSPADYKTIQSDTITLISIKLDFLTPTETTRQLQPPILRFLWFRLLGYWILAKKCRSNQSKRQLVHQPIANSPATWSVQFWSSYHSIAHPAKNPTLKYWFIGSNLNLPRDSIIQTLIFQSKNLKKVSTQLAIKFTSTTSPIIITSYWNPGPSFS